MSRWSCGVDGQFLDDVLQLGNTLTVVKFASTLHTIDSSFYYYSRRVLRDCQLTTVDGRIPRERT